MKYDFKGLVNKTKYFIGKHSPEILTGLGITGMLTSTVLAVTATPKALRLIENKKKELKTDELTTVETIKAAWKPYIPAVSTSVASIACLICASRVNYKRNAALATAYSLSERTLSHYREKVIETIGEKKEKAIRDKVNQEEVEKNKLQSSQVIIAAGGDTLCMDSMSGRYFKSDMESIKQAVNKLNRRLTYENYISLNEFYGEIGLNDVRNGELLGWNIDSGLIEPTFSTCLTEDGRPCIVLDFMVEPRYDYDKLL